VLPDQKVTLAPPLQLDSDLALLEIGTTTPSTPSFGRTGMRIRTVIEPSFVVKIESPVRVQCTFVTAFRERTRKTFDESQRWKTTQMKKTLRLTGIRKPPPTLLLRILMDVRLKIALS